MRNLPRFSGEKIDSADNHLDVCDGNAKINVVDASVVQIIARFGYSLFCQSQKFV